MAEENHKRAVREFITTVKRTYEAGEATEHTYRPALTLLCDTLGAGEVRAINEAKRIRCGAPDITLMHEDIAIGYIEAKDIGVSIRNHRGANKIQFDRYTSDLDNLIYTDCLKWDFYLNGDLVRSVSIAEIRGGALKPKPDNFDELADYLLDFLGQRPKTIKTAEDLTEYMAKKTRIIRHAFEKAMADDVPLEALTQQRESFDKMLVKDISPQKFADMYAQTITYGMFVARLYSKNPVAFSRQEAQKLLPTTYPFLKDLFKFIASEDLNESIDWAIDSLINLYRAADVERIMATYQQGTGREDPFLHFYEAFLTAYNPLERKRSGVYYTPEPVVDFIVRGVDWVLKNKFDLHNGLAHSEKTKVPWKTDNVGDLEKREVHKVQILDPATGTGTFLAQTIRHIAKQVKPSAPGNWDSYVDKDLLPRLHGFEFMMAPYVMSYLKLDMVLAELGYEPTKEKPDRMSIYLTNSLTGANKDIPVLPFAKWLENEARGAADIKDNYPIMCVIGNPPYNAKSKNNDPWIEHLIEDYKKEPGGHAPLKERKHVLYDDYVKFIRMAQHMVEKNGEGVVGMITNHGYLDGPTFRGMRWNLMNSFDEIYILDLHGKKRNGDVGLNEDDGNVFDIKTGVSIIIAWRTKHAKGTEKPLAQVSRGDLWGERTKKFNALMTTDLDSKLFKKIIPRAPKYYFTSKNYSLLKKYEKGFKITEFMSENSVGIITRKDKITIDIDEAHLWNRIKDIATMSLEEIREKYSIFNDTATWKLPWAKDDIEENYDKKFLKKILYRPFDERWTYYTGKSTGFMSRPLKNIMHHFLKDHNLGLITQRKAPQDGSWTDIFMTNKIIDVHITGSQSSIFPLYLYPNGNKDLDTNGHSRRVNMDKKIRKNIEDIATDSKNGKPDEIQIFDYIYGVLHAPDYRKLYSEFLQDDFPYIPYPKDSSEFWYLSSIGTKLRKLHLIEGWDSPAVYTFKGKGDGIVERVKFNDGKVWINETQYFDSVPEFAWKAFIGEHQPAKLWLNKRKGRTLEHKDILHYQRIIAVLVQTKTTMDDIKWSRP